MNLMTNNELEDALIDILDEIHLRQTQFITVTTISGGGNCTLNLPDDYKFDEVALRSPGRVEYTPPKLPDMKTEIDKKVEVLNKSLKKRLDDALFEHQIGFQKLVASLCLFTGIIILAGAIWPG